MKVRFSGGDYVRLFKKFPLLPIRDEEHLADALEMELWLDGRTQLQQSAIDYKAVLEMTIADYLASRQAAETEADEFEVAPEEFLERTEEAECLTEKPLDEEGEHVVGKPRGRKKS